MWASITSSLGSLGNSLVGFGARNRLDYVGGGSLDAEARENLGYVGVLGSGAGESWGTNGEGLGGSGKRGHAAEDPDRHLIASVPGVVEVHDLLGSGSFGDVWECGVEGQEDHVAVKVFRPGVGEQQTRECQLHVQLQHPNLVQLLQVVEGPPVAICMELCRGGTLWRLIHEPAHREVFSRITVRARLRAALDVVSCVEYLHANNILHRDVKPTNCLLSAVHKADMEWIPQIKLADLGLARFEAQSMSKRVGTLLYMAPELMEEENYGLPVDIYSCGILLYELVTGLVPYSTSSARLQNDVAFILAVAGGERPAVKDLPVNEATEDLGSILYACWDVDPAVRPTSATLADRLRNVPDVA